MIREAKISDLETLSEILLNDNTKEMANYENFLIRDALTNYNKVVFIDYENEIPVAFAQCSLIDEEKLNPIASLDQICIKKNYQNKGIAKRLLVKCEAWAKEKECKKFSAKCNIEDINTMNMYSHSGFSEVNKVAYFSKDI